MSMWRSLRRREYAGSAGRRLPGTCTPNPLFRPRAPRPEDGMALHQRQGQVPCLPRTPCPRPDTANVPAALATKLVINPRGLRHDPPGSGHPLFDRLDEALAPRGAAIRPLRPRPSAGHRLPAARPPGQDDLSWRLRTGWRQRSRPGADQTFTIAWETPGELKPKGSAGQSSHARRGAAAGGGAKAGEPERTAIQMQRMRTTARGGYLAVQTSRIGSWHGRAAWDADSLLSASRADAA